MSDNKAHQGLLKKAWEIADERMPNASAFHKAAFANSVATILTGGSEGYGGPSIREHVAVEMFGNSGMKFEEVVEELIKSEGLIFGPLRQEHLEAWDKLGHICFDDDPKDLSALMDDNLYLN
jgi:hypothetical protein